jgi:predicted CopG family antitoxin
MKTISTRDDIYEALRNMKGENESFSDVIEKLLIRKVANLERFFGVLRDSEVLNGLEEDSKKIRESSKLRI